MSVNFFFFGVIYRRNFMPMQITAHAIGIAMRFALSGAEWDEAELSLSCSASFFFLLFGGIFF